MALREFEAIVRMIRLRTSGGFDENKSSFVSTKMEFEGRVTTFNYADLADLRDNLTEKYDSKVSIKIEFCDEKKQYDHFSDKEHPYIGTIELFREERETLKNKLSAYVEIYLPNSMLPILHQMRDEWIYFDTINDLIHNPTEHQKEKGCVALIKRVNFESYKAEETPKKHFTLSFG